MAKATNMGTCQICGNVQKLPSGYLSRHGYTVEYGYFDGTCRGSDGLPFEQSTGLIADAIENVKAANRSIAERITELETETDSATLRLYSKKSWKYHWEKVMVSQMEVITEGDYVRVSFHRDGERRHDVGFEESLDEVIKEANEPRIKYLHRMIKSNEEWIAWQNKRVANWVEKPLLPLGDK